MDSQYQNSVTIFILLTMLIIFNNLLLKNNNSIIYLITILLILPIFVYITILYIKYYIIKEKYAFKQNNCNNSVNNDIIQSWQAPYSTLDNVNKNDGWEITKAKKCCGVNLDWLDKNSDIYKYCSDPKNQDVINRYCCESSGINGEQGCKGFNGKPLSFEYSSETNSDWKNGRESNPLHSNLMPPIL
jgi:hypothetical protein